MSSRSIGHNTNQFRLFDQKQRRIPSIDYDDYSHRSYGDMPFNQLYGGKVWFNKLRDNIRDRDGWQCQRLGCGVYGEFGNKGLIVLDVHHIDCNKRNHDERNLITLCKSCHSLTNLKRTLWKIYYTDVIEKIYAGTWNPVVVKKEINYEQLVLKV